jgi:hypothetical protein
MCTDGTPVPPYLAKWSCTVQAAPAPDVAVAHTAAWARATMDNWGLGGLAGDVGLIVLGRMRTSARRRPRRLPGQAEPIPQIRFQVRVMITSGSSCPVPGW